MLGEFFQPLLEASLSYGPRRFAYTGRRGYKDALAYNVLSWILAISTRGRVGLYCSDVFGAFDRVSTLRLLTKLRRACVPLALLPIFAQWLDMRTSKVTVDGARAQCRNLQNSVYQGTVWGPPFWNVLFADARRPINVQGFIESVFADDCICRRRFDGNVDDATILDELRHCQAAVHERGRGNQVFVDDVTRLRKDSTSSTLAGHLAIPLNS